MHRFRHVMRGNARTESPSYFVAIAARDRAERERPRSLKWVHHFDRVAASRWRMEGGLITRESTMVTSQLDGFWQWFYASLTKERPLWVWMDDLTYHASILDLWNQLDRGRLVHRTAVVTSRVGYISLIAGDARAVWVDRQNWWRDKIDKSENPMQELREIQARVSALWRFLRRHDLGVLRVTASGQSLQAYRHRFGPKISKKHVPTRGKNRGKVTTRQVVLPLVHNHADALELEEGALHGGPVHCWFLGKVKNPVYILDVQSLYPAIMHLNSFPCKLISCRVVNIPESKAKLWIWCNAIATVRIKTDLPIFPLKKDGVTIYPVGKFTTTLAGPELELAVRSGKLLSVSRVARYETCELFSKFAQFFWDLRKGVQSKADPYWHETVKIILNSLHGKFAQRSAEWKETPKVPAAKRWGYWHDVAAENGKVFFRRAISGRVQTSAPSGWADHSFPAVSAFVYSHARLYMNRLFEVARAGQVYYSAIDSIHCNQEARDALVSAGWVQPNKLGFLREVGVYNGMVYHGPNDYERDGQRVQSGTPEGAEICSNGDLRWKEHEAGSQVIERGPDGTLITRLLRVKRSSVFKWGRPQANGWVLPLAVKE